MKEEETSVLFIGLGKMGNPMATNLADAGVPLAVVDISAPALEPFATRGIPTASYGGALEGEIVITMLPTDRHVRGALFGAGGALESKTRRVVIDMSSSEPSATKATAAQLSELGVAMLDAPVSGGVPKARSGDLTTMVGGDAAVLERCRGLLSIMCGSVQHVGPVGAGHTVKALNNFLSGVGLWASCEALLVGARAGLDPQKMVDAWSKSTGANNALETKIREAVLPRTFDWGFSLELIAKDVSIAARLARELDVPTPMLAASEEHWLMAKASAGGDSDFTNVARVLERWAGFEIPAVARSGQGPRQ
ncbi:MAG: NAD(P)-dependent oxidoreductase [Candidatus Eremiobacteraeota bacterium]|nr:NAD(P)-dependent oxidoreductase [Candidatus Eremiobacteraeota bacterium]